MSLIQWRISLACVFTKDSTNSCVKQSKAIRAERRRTTEDTLKKIMIKMLLLYLSFYNTFEVFRSQSVGKFRYKLRSDVATSVTWRQIILI